MVSKRWLKISIDQQTITIQTSRGKNETKDNMVDVSHNIRLAVCR